VAVGAAEVGERLLPPRHGDGVHDRPRRRGSERPHEPGDVREGGRVDLGVRHVVVVEQAPERPPLRVRKREPELGGERVAGELVEVRHLRLPAEPGEPPAVRVRRLARDAERLRPVVRVREGHDVGLVDAFDQTEAEQRRGLAVLEHDGSSLRPDRIFRVRVDPVQDRADGRRHKRTIRTQQSVTHHVDAARTGAPEHGLEVARPAGVAVEPGRADALVDREVPIEPASTSQERGFLLP
jgi:hypothetical protein